MSGCPQCGGAKRIAVAPHYWQCCTETEETYQEWVPTLVGEQRAPAGPGGQMVPIAPIYVDKPVTRTRAYTCTARYHEALGAAGTPVVMCRCGTLPIGVCASCGDWVCGDHSHLRAEVRACTVCATADKAARQARDQAQRVSSVTASELAEWIIAGAPRMPGGKPPPHYGTHLPASVVLGALRAADAAPQTMRLNAAAVPQTLRGWLLAAGRSIGPRPTTYCTIALDSGEFVKVRRSDWDDTNAEVTSFEPSATLPLTQVADALAAIQDGNIDSCFIP